MLNVEKINAFYGDFHVLHDVSLNLKKGELVAVIGANGHGKSTLLKAVCGLIPISAGKITLAGEDIAPMKDFQLVGKGLVYVAEDRRLFPDMTVLENLLLGAFLPRGRAKKTQNLDYVFTLFPQLCDRRHQLCRTLSGGESQMVALGRGLMSNPSIMAIDEPSLGLAPNLTQTMLESLLTLNKEGVTILIVEQSLALLQGMIDQVYSIEEGVITTSNVGVVQIRR